MSTNLFPFTLFLFLSVSLIGVQTTVMDEVVILDGPSSGFVVKNKPYILSCRAVNAKKIRFKCNSKWLDESRHENVLGTDPSSQLPYMESTVEIGRQEVDTTVHLEDFVCQCYASGTSESHVVRSDSARIKVAYMRKHFLVSPHNERVPEGSTVQLACSPPESDPKSQVFWLKNGVEITRGDDSNIIYGNDGSLILSAARLTDSANYTCEARNILNRRATEPAELKVYVDGGWSEWHSWAGTCHVDCQLLRTALVTNGVDVIPRLRRIRTCNNPAPLNGGANCPGVEEEFRVCELPCKIDGKWSEWGEWSECSVTCNKVRTRTCTSPPPLNGGASCFGREIDSSNCTTGFCHQLPQHVSPLAGHELAVYGGLGCVLVLLAIIMTLCAALLCKKNKGKKANNNIYYAETGAHVRRVLLDQQHNTLLNDDCIKIPVGSQYFSPSPLHPSMTLRSGKSGYSGYTTTRNAGSRAALITECSSNSSSDRGKRTLLRTNSNCSEDENYATLYDYMEDKSVNSLENSQGLLAAQIDAGGGRMQLLKSQACLLIPENAIEEERMIYMAVTDRISERPRLPPGEVCLSPVVIVGECESERDPETRILRRPVVVSFKHCASTFPKDNWQFSLWADDGFGWKQVLRLGEENLNSTMHLHIDSANSSKANGMGWCHVMTETFGRMMLSGRARRASIAPCKRVHLACYGPAHPTKGDFDLRVYCVPETGTAMEYVRRQEEEQGRLLSESEHFILQPSGELCFCIEDVSEGFISKGQPVMEIPPTHHQWCSQNGLHCSIQVANDGTRTPEDFNGRIVVYQKTNPAERHVLNVQLDTSEYNCPPEADKIVTLNFQLPGDVKEDLSILLDPPTDIERDWRGLARKLKYDRYIQYFATRPGCSPTSLLLDLWESIECGSIRAVHDLLQTLRVMGRPDAVLVLERYLAHFNYDQTP